MKQIDTDGNGQISYKEFYRWWRKDDHGVPEVDQNGNAQEGTSKAKMRLLKTRLASQRYMKSVKYYLDRVARKDALSKVKEATEAVPHDTIKGAVSVTVGSLEENHTLFELALSQNGKGGADQEVRQCVRLQAGLTPPWLSSSSTSWRVLAS